MEFLATAAASLTDGLAEMPWEKLGISGIALFAMKFVYDMAVARLPNHIMTGKKNGNGCGIPTEIRNELHDVYSVTMATDGEGYRLTHFPRSMIDHQHSQQLDAIKKICDSQSRMTQAQEQTLKVTSSLVDVVKDLKRDIQGGQARN